MSILQKKYTPSDDFTVKTPENTPEQSQWRRSGVFIVNFEHISHIVPGFSDEVHPAV